MKKILLVSITALCLGNFAYAAPIVVNGGVVHFQGEFVNASCAVSTDTEDQIVHLGQHRTAAITAAAQYTANVPFSIKLVDCDTSTIKTAQFAFSGPRDTTDATLLKVSSGPSTNAVTASGVGIEINDSAGSVITPNGAVLSKAETLINGNNIINFIARYKSTAAAVTAGQAYADANFVVSYQ